MKRRTFLSTFSFTALGGCSQLQPGQLETSKTDRSWPDARGSNATSNDREWRGGHWQSEKVSSRLILEDIEIEIVSAEATTQIGVFTGETNRRHKGFIPSSEFDWYTAPEYSFFWILFLSPSSPDEDETLRLDKDESLPPAENWRALPGGNPDIENPRPTLPFTATFDPDPTHYRIPSGLSSDTMDFDRVRNAYTTGSTEFEFRLLVFEVQSPSIKVQYGGPVEMEWVFTI